MYRRIYIYKDIQTLSIYLSVCLSVCLSVVLSMYAFAVVYTRICMYSYISLMIHAGTLACTYSFWFWGVLTSLAIHKEVLCARISNGCSSLHWGCGVKETSLSGLLVIPWLIVSVVDGLCQLSFFLQCQAVKVSRSGTRYVKV